MNKTLYIYGAGGHAKVVAATARLLGYEIKGFCEDSTDRIGHSFCEASIIPFADIPRNSNLFIAFGDNSARYRKVVELNGKYHFPTLIHPSAQVADGVIIGIGCFIAALSNIDPACRIGDACIVNTLSNISHDSQIDNGVHICGGVTIAGSVSVGECCCIGIGSRIIEKISIGDHVIVGAGAVVIKDLPSNCTAVGIPAKIIKTHAE